MCIWSTFWCFASSGRNLACAPETALICEPKNSYIRMMVKFASEVFSIWTVIIMMLFPKNPVYIKITHVHNVYRPHGSWADMCIAIFCHPHLRWCILSLQGTARPRIQLLLRDRGWQIKLSAYSCSRRHCSFQYTCWKSTWPGAHPSHQSPSPFWWLKGWQWLWKFTGRVWDSVYV